MQNANENKNVQVARAFLSKCAFNVAEGFRMSDSDFFRCHQTDKKSISKLFMQMFDPSNFVKKCGP